jgi:hypothetical protein
MNVNLHVAEWREKEACRLGLETLNEDAIKKRDNGLDGLESCTGSLVGS